MASNAPQLCCVSGFKHDGESVGSYKTFDGINAYISYPPDKSTEHAILYLPDAFGLELINNRLLADDMARAGYLVVIPDIFSGDACPDPLLADPEQRKNFNIQAWLQKHPISAVDPIVEATIKEMRTNMGVKRMGAVGYCFGGKYVVRFLAPGRGIDAGFVAHPSFADAAEVEAIANPLSIAAPEEDQVFPAEKRRETEDILYKKDVPYQMCLYSDCQHGFAVRTDLKDRKKRFAKESAYFQAVRWFDEWVKEPGTKG